MDVIWWVKKGGHQWENYRGGTKTLPLQVEVRGTQAMWFTYKQIFGLLPHLTASLSKWLPLFGKYRNFMKNQLPPFNRLVSTTIQFYNVTEASWLDAQNKWTQYMQSLYNHSLKFKELISAAFSEKTDLPPPRHFQFIICDLEKYSKIKRSNNQYILAWLILWFLT